MDLFSARAQQHGGNRGIKSSTADGLAFGMFGVCTGILSLGFLYIPHATFPSSDTTIVIMSARSYGPTCRAVFSVVWTYSRAFVSWHVLRLAAFDVVHYLGWDSIPGVK